jgi:molecular chaperone GrpE
MSEYTPPAVVGNAAVGAPENLTPEAIETILADFRSWLQQLPTSASPAPSADEAEPIDLHTLLGQFIALRHEVNLQTKAVRGQQEQNADTLRRLSQALDALQAARDASQEASEEARDVHIRPLLKVLVDVADALGLARREIQRVQQTILSSLERLAITVSAPPEPPGPAPAPAGFWTRWFGSSRVEPPMAAPSDGRKQTEELAMQIRQLLESLIAGYTMSLQRIERALRQQGLEPMACTGQPFDPERMEVMEAVADSGRPAGEVIEDVRPGYLWHGRVFRYAQVRVARP